MAPMNFKTILNVCREILGNSRLVQQISTKHDHLFKKTSHYLKRLSPHEKSGIGTFKVTDQPDETMYLVPEMKPHTAGEILIHPACAAIVRTMLGTEAEEIKKFFLSMIRCVDI
jgi:hypothetical protein